jgi:hypothetical protein
MRDGARIEEDQGVAVRVVVPQLFPALPPLRVGAESGLEPGDG